MHIYFSAHNPLSLPPYRADADGAASHPDSDGHVGGVQEGHAGGAAARLGLCGSDLPLLGPPAALSQKPLWSAAGTPTGCKPT